MPTADIVPDGRDVVPLAETYPRNTAAVLDPCGTRHDRADHGIECSKFVDFEKRCASVEPFETNIAGVHAELFIEGLAKQRLSSDPRSR